MLLQVRNPCHGPTVDGPTNNDSFGSVLDETSDANNANRSPKLATNVDSPSRKHQQSFSNQPCGETVCEKSSTPTTLEYTKRFTPHNILEKSSETDSSSQEEQNSGAVVLSDDKSRLSTSEMFSTMNKDGNNEQSDKETTGQCQPSTTVVATTKDSTTTTIAAAEAEAEAAPASDDYEFSSTISMNWIDEEDALDRLLFDLTQDEISMVIGLFGGGSDDGDPIEQHDSDLLPAESSPPATEKKHAKKKSSESESHSIPVFHPPLCPDGSPCPKGVFQSPTLLEQSTCDSGKGFQSPPRSLFELYNPMVGNLGFHASRTAIGDCSPNSYPQPQVGRPTATTRPLALEANNRCSHHSACVIPVPVHGIAPIPVTVATEQPMAKRSPATAPGNKKASSKRIGRRLLSSSAPPLKKRAIVKKTGDPDSDDSVSSSSNTADATTTKRSKVAPVTQTETKAKSTKAKPSKAKPSKAKKTVVYIPNISAMDEERWDGYLREAQEFVSTYGHCRIPTTYPSNPDLANWAKRQRYHHKLFKIHVLDRPNNPSVVTNAPLPKGSVRHKKPGVRQVKCLMTFSRLAKLEAIGFCMDLQATHWELMYEQLCDYVKQTKGRTYPSKHTHYDLWKWTGTQRYQKKYQMKLEESSSSSSGSKKKQQQQTRQKFYLTRERIAKLNAINFAWVERAAIKSASTKS